MRVLVCGGRNYHDKLHVYRTLDGLHKRLMIDVLIEGDAFGVDRIAGYWARKNGIDNLKYRADWAKHGHAAGPIRNQKMLEEGRPDLVVAFPGGRGTADMVRRALDAGVGVRQIEAVR